MRTGMRAAMDSTAKNASALPPLRSTAERATRPTLAWPSCTRLSAATARCLPYKVCTVMSCTLSASPAVTSCSVEDAGAEKDGAAATRHDSDSRAPTVPCAGSATMPGPASRSNSSGQLKGLRSVTGVKKVGHSAAASTRMSRASADETSCGGTMMASTGTETVWVLLRVYCSVRWRGETLR